MASTAKGYKGMAMEGPIASWYAGITRTRQTEFEAAVRTVARTVPAGGAVLEIAPGPGYLAILLAQAGYRVTGLDISRSFVQIAQKNAHAAGVSVDFRHGSASQMPFGNASFDGSVCLAAFKNFSDPLGALNEMQRVLRPGGTAYVMDMRGDATEAELDEEAGKMKLGRINRWMVKWTFKHMLLRNAYTPASFQDLAARSAFGGCEVKTDLIGMTVRTSK